MNAEPFVIKCEMISPCLIFKCLAVRLDVYTIVSTFVALAIACQCKPYDYVELQEKNGKKRSEDECFPCKYAVDIR